MINSESNERTSILFEDINSKEILYSNMKEDN